jgi:CheY-like chemotaxis protein/predicted regulator of Ras-like GTPase activity (Roadblock/LC7/MglB family)
VLLVDDEELFLRTCVEGFAAANLPYRVLTAPNGRAAAEILAREPVDLVVTDLHMPEVDGFGLLAYMSRACPHVPAVVMTAFGTPLIEQQMLDEGVMRLLDKPLDFHVLARAVAEALAETASGHMQGIALTTVLQMIEADRKTCAVHVRHGDLEGILHFQRGLLVDAECGGTVGWDAALQLVAWPHPEIEFRAGRKRRERRIVGTLTELLLEGARQSDERAREPEEPRGGWSTPASVAPASGGDVNTETLEDDMAASDKLKELATVDGFAGAALYTPTGEPLAILAGDNHRLKEIGVLANAVLLNAQRAAVEMGAGNAFEVNVDADRADILVHCLNEGPDVMKTAPGKAHIHLVVVLKNDESIGLARLRMRTVIEKLAPEFR